MADAPLTYEAATARLEAIIRRLDSGEAGLRETLDLVREGRGLVEFCAGELDAVGSSGRRPIGRLRTRGRMPREANP
jgi:exodeoxyribonuclease VII small subunit